METETKIDETVSMNTENVNSPYDSNEMLRIINEIDTCGAFFVNEKNWEHDDIAK